MHTKETYTQFRKPSWAPPSWLFGPVWTFLYILIFISFGSVFVLAFQNKIPLSIGVPFILNLIFNFSFTYFQFKLKNNYLAALDIILVLATLIWATIAIAPFAPWIAYLQIPYLAWGAFATVLQLVITGMNR